jgi:hypothetical protein
MKEQIELKKARPEPRKVRTKLRKERSKSRKEQLESGKEETQPRQARGRHIEGTTKERVQSGQE